MSVSRVPVVLILIGLVAAASVGWTAASDPSPARRPLVQESPAFQAPADPPAEPSAEGEPLAPEPAAPIVLQEALALALMRNPELQMFSWDVRAAEARTLQAGKWINPELDVRFYRLGIARAGRESEERRTRVILSQVFELGGKRHRRVVLGQVETDLAGWDYEAKRIDVASTVASHFVAVLGAQLRVESLRQFVAFVDQTRRQVQMLVDTGALRSLAIHQVTRQLGLSRIELHRAEADLGAARYRLAATWGAESPRFTRAVGDLEEVRPIPGIETVIELARQSPGILRWDAELARSQAALSLARARRVPDLRAGVGVRWEQYVDQRDYLVDLEIDLPLFDRKQGEIREAQFNMARARAGRESAEALSAESIAEFYYLVTESEARIATLGEQVVPAARAAFEAITLGFERDAQGLDDLIAARRDLARAEVQYTDALVDYHLALTGLEGVAGQSLAAAE